MGADSKSASTSAAAGAGPGCVIGRCRSLSCFRPRAEAEACRRLRSSDEGGDGTMSSSGTVRRARLSAGALRAGMVGALRALRAEGGAAVFLTAVLFRATAFRAVAFRALALVRAPELFRAAVAPLPTPVVAFLVFRTPPLALVRDAERVRLPPARPAAAVRRLAADAALRLAISPSFRLP